MWVEYELKSKQKKVYLINLLEEYPIMKYKIRLLLLALLM